MFASALFLCFLVVKTADEEIFDVVDERDEVVGRAARSEVHRRKLRHRAVHVLVFNRRGEVFLQKRSMLKDTARGKWDSSASGHLASGEDYAAGAVRELREEIGLDLGHIHLTPSRTAAKLKPSSASLAPVRETTTASGLLEKLFKIEACGETGWEFCWVYRCQSEGPFTLHPGEIERGDWYLPAFVTRWVTERPWDFASAFVLIWKLLNRGDAAAQS
jgi:isopentenyldiphosphate isomerase